MVQKAKASSRKATGIHNRLDKAECKCRTPRSAPDVKAQSTTSWGGWIDREKLSCAARSAATRDDSRSIHTNLDPDGFTIPRDLTRKGADVDQVSHPKYDVK